MIKIWMWKLDGSNDYNAAFLSLTVCSEAILMLHFHILRLTVNKAPDSIFYQCVDNKEAINQKTKTFLKNRLYAIIVAITVNYFIGIATFHLWEFLLVNSVLAKSLFSPTHPSPRILRCVLQQQQEYISTIIATRLCCVTSIRIHEVQ